MLGISMNELKRSGTFSQVCKRFIKWCGDDAIFCTWGTQDLTELQRNMNYYNLEPLSDGPLMFYNIQSIYSDHIGGEDKAYNLEAAVDNLGLSKEIPFHRAYADAYYTAKVFDKIEDPDVLEKFSKEGYKSSMASIIADKYISLTVFNYQETKIANRFSPP